MERKILKWAEIAQNELHCFDNMDHTINLFNILDEQGLLHIEELSEDKGVVAYMIYMDARGYLMCSEMFMYVRKEYRGNARLFKQIIDIMEQAAKENHCKYVCIGSNIGYRDEKVLNILSRFGYKVDTVKKEI